MEVEVGMHREPQKGGLGVVWRVASEGASAASSWLLVQGDRDEMEGAVGVVEVARQAADAPLASPLRTSRPPKSIGLLQS